MYGIENMDGRLNFRAKRVLVISSLGAAMLLPTHGFSANLVVTPGSSAAYVFCTKSKNSCPKSTVGRWMFKLQHEDNVADASKKQDAFRNGGTSGNRLLWNTGTAALQVIDRVYVGYGEFKTDPSDPTRGTFSGIVDMPPLAAPASCPTYSNYCTMSGPGTGLTTDTPFRTCTTTYTWTAFGGPATATGTSWNPNTGVIECAHPLGSFGTNMGNGTGNCVAHYVQRRGTSSPLFGGYHDTDYIYQARVYDLQIRQASDFTDASCTAISN